MKKIEAVIKPSKVEAVRDALAHLGVNSVTTTEVASSGRRNGLNDVGSGGGRASELQAKIKLEVVVTDALSGPAISAIVEAARTGSVSDGSVFVFQVEGAIRVHTGETAELALC